MSPFVTPQSAAVAIGVAAAVLLWLVVAPLRFGGRATKAVACMLYAAVAAAGWWIASVVTADRLPPLTYSLTVLTADQAAAVKANGEGAWILFRVTNESDTDVSDLRIVLYLPDFLSASPRTVSPVRVDGLGARPSYAVVTKKDSPTAPVEVVDAGLTNVAVVEAQRLLAHGSFAIVLPVRGAPIQENPEDGRYGGIRVERRHQHYNVQVRDTEVLPIVAAAGQSDLLGAPVDSTTRFGVFSPQLKADTHLADMEKGGTLNFEMTLE